MHTVPPPFFKDDPKRRAASTSLRLRLSLALNLLLAAALIKLAHPGGLARQQGTYTTPAYQPAAAGPACGREEGGMGLCTPHAKCIFVVSTGRSGSTNLQDALNQLPGVFVRGENWGLFHDLQRLSAKVRAARGGAAVDLAANAAQRGAAHALEEYERFVAAKKKPAWVSGWCHGMDQCLASMVFKKLYGEGQFSDYMVGFKELRYGPHAANSSYAGYATLEAHLDWLKGLCLHSRVVLNMRRDVSATAQSDWYRSDPEAVQKLAVSSAWFGQYAKEHSDAFTVYFEDMFDPEVNATLARDLLEFLGVPWVDISFARIGGGWGYPKADEAFWQANRQGFPHVN